MPPLDTSAKLLLFRTCFGGLQHVYGTYDPKTGQVRQVKAPVTDGVLLAHFQGRQPYGAYLLTGSTTQALVADFDYDDAWPPVMFVRRARHYGLSAYLERSKRKGWHAWVFCVAPGVSAAKGRRVVKQILEDIEWPRTEIFPKQDVLPSLTSYGNFINAPLFGLLVPRGRTLFVDPNHRLEPFTDQWAVLGQVQRVSEAQLDQIIADNDLSPSPPPPHASTGLGAICPTAATFGLPPCAQQLLVEGVTEFQRVACFRLAIHLKKTGLPVDLTVALLQLWAQRNRPTDGKGRITSAEVAAQAQAAYRRPYRSCGCQHPLMASRCQTNCPVYVPRHQIAHAPNIAGSGLPTPLMTRVSAGSREDTAENPAAGRVGRTP